MSPDQAHGRLAVLIDADNTTPRLVAEVLDELTSYGTLTVKRAYGDWTTQHLTGWKPHLLAHAISPIQQFAYTMGKNSTDSALIIDAMDLLYSGHVDGFAIVSSDSDFTRLATRLKESGMQVLGVGQRKTPKPFVEACEKFIFLEVLSAEPGAEPEDEPEDEGSKRVKLDQGALQSLVIRTLAKTAQDDGWSPMGGVGSQLVRQDPGFDARTYGFSKLSELMESLPYVEVTSMSASDPGGGRLWVRPKQARKRASGTSKEATAKKSSGARKSSGGKQASS